MAEFIFGGNPSKTVGDLPAPGEKAPDFLLTRTDFSDVSLSDLAGKTVVLNIFPSIDTPVCTDRNPAIHWPVFQANLGSDLLAAALQRYGYKLEIFAASGSCKGCGGNY